MNEFLLKIEELIKSGDISKEEAAAFFVYLNSFPKERPSSTYPYSLLNMPMRRLGGVLEKYFDANFTREFNPQKLWDFFNEKGVTRENANPASRRIVGIIDFMNTNSFYANMITPEEMESDWKRLGTNGDAFPSYPPGAVLPAHTEEGDLVFITPFKMKVQWIDGIKYRTLTGGDYVQAHNLSNTLEQITNASKWTNQNGDVIQFDKDSDIQDVNGNTISPADLQQNVDYGGAWSKAAVDQFEKHGEYLKEIGPYDPNDPGWVKKIAKNIKNPKVEYSIYAVAAILMTMGTARYYLLGRQIQAAEAVGLTYGVDEMSRFQGDLGKFVHVVEYVLSGYKATKGMAYLTNGDLVNGYGQLGIVIVFLFFADTIGYAGLLARSGVNPTGPLGALITAVVATLLSKALGAVAGYFSEKEMEDRRKTATVNGWAPGAYSTHDLKIPMSQFGHILEVNLHREFLRRQQVWDSEGRISTADVVLGTDLLRLSDGTLVPPGYDWAGDNLLPYGDPTVWWNMEPGDYPIHFGLPIEDAKSRLNEAIQEDLNKKNENNQIDPNLGKVPDKIDDPDDVPFLVPEYEWGVPWPDWVPSWEDLAEEAIRNGFGDQEDLNKVFEYNSFMNSVAEDVEYSDGSIGPNITNDDITDYKDNYVDNTIPQIAESVIAEAVSATQDPETKNSSKVEETGDGQILVEPDRKQEPTPETEPKKVNGVDDNGKPTERQRPGKKKQKKQRDPKKKTNVNPNTPRAVAGASKRTGGGGKKASRRKVLREFLKSMGLTDKEIDTELGKIPAKWSDDEIKQGATFDFGAKKIVLIKNQAGRGYRNQAGRKKAKQVDVKPGTGGSGTNTGGTGGSGTGGTGGTPAATCFPEYTMVSTPNGKKQISDISIGDAVLSYDINGNICESHVTHKFIHDANEKSDVYEYKLSNGNVLHITQNHPVLLSNNEYEQIGNLNETHFIVDEFGNFVSILSNKFIGNMVVYNLEVEETHTYIADGIRVHNDIRKDERINRNQPGTPGNMSPWDGFNRGPYIDTSDPGSGQGGGGGDTSGGGTGGGTSTGGGGGTSTGGGGGTQTGGGGGGTSTGGGGGGTSTGGGGGGTSTGGGKSLACFPSWVKISTPSGLIEIKNINLTDIIYSFDSVGNIIEDTVSHYICHDVDENQEVIRYMLSNGIIFDVTENHGVVNEQNEFVAIGSMRIGDSLITEAGELTTILSKESIGIHEVYNISTKNYGTYISNGIRVSGDWSPSTL